MSDILERFTAVVDRPYEAAEAWKREHKQPVMGIALCIFLRKWCMQQEYYL